MPGRIPIRPAALALAVALAVGCGDEGPAPDAETAQAPVVVPVPPAAAPRPGAVLEIEGMGEIELELFADVAPRTVENFVKLANEDFFDGTTFHRVIPGFMIQGGDPNTLDRDPRNDGQGGPGYRIEGEVSDLSHVRGIVSMAHNGNPDAAGSQFFIVHQDNLHLDGQYAAFGRVTRGLEVVDAIAKVERDLYGRWGPVDRPREDVRIADVRVLEPDERSGPPAAPAERPADGAPAQERGEWSEGPA